MISKSGFSPVKLTALCTALALILIQSVSAYRGSDSSLTATADIDISSESRTLDSYFNDLRAFDKKCAEFDKKSSLTRAELDPIQRTSDDLKNRLSSVQNALREIVRKFKAAGQFDDLDAKLTARIRDARFQSVAREESFKRVLEEFASQLTSNASEVSAPVETLRRKVAQARDSGIEAEFKSRAVQVTYSPPVKSSFRCRLAWLRVGLSAAVSSTGDASHRSSLALGCYCLGNQNDCSALNAL